MKPGYTGTGAAKEVAKVALAAHDRVDMLQKQVGELEKRIIDLEYQINLVLDWKP